MNGTLATWSIRHPTPTVLLFVLLTVAGLLAFRGMPIQAFPDLDVPMVSVSVRLPGASPAQLETDVVRPIEDAIATLTGLEHIESRLQDGSATLLARFHLDQVTATAVDDVRDAVARVRGDLPPELLDPVVRRVEFTGSLLLAYTVRSPRRDALALSWFVDNDVVRALRALQGVGEVSRVGGLSRQVSVELDPARLLELGVTPAEVSRQLRETRHDATGGRTDPGGREHAIRLLASARSAEDLGGLDIVLADGRAIRLDRLARISDGPAEPRSAATLDGEPVIGVEIKRAPGAGDVEVARRVRQAVAALQASHPDVIVTEAVDLVTGTADNYVGSIGLLAEGALLAVVVVALFLRDARATVIAAIALPLSVMPAFAVMHLLGFTLNVVTLLSLSLVIGLLVDDAIVEIENIKRHLAAGSSPRKAAMTAANEIGLAVVATTFALVAVFLPTAFMGGIVGRFFIQFGWTAAVAVLFSLLVARMVTPLLAARLLRRPTSMAIGTPRWVEACVTAAAACLNHRGLIGLLVAGLVVGSGMLALRLPGTFLPPADDAWSQVRLSLVPGSTLDDSRAAADQVWRRLRDLPEIRHVYATIGAGSAGDDPVGAEASDGGNVRTATLTLGLSDRSERPGRSKQVIEQALRAALADLPGIRVTVGRDDDSQAYELVLASEDHRLLLDQARQIEGELRALPGVAAVTSSAGLWRPELIVRPDFARAADLGVTSAAIAETLRVATAGDYDDRLAKVVLGERRLPVVVKLADAARDDPEVLGRLPVRGASGPVPLASVADLEVAGGPIEITRRDRMRDLRLVVEADGLLLGELEDAVETLPGLKALAPGVIHASAGDAETRQDLIAGFTVAMGLGVLSIYVVLVLLLGSFALPLTVLAALVLSLPGAVAALQLTESALSMPSLIGLVMLMGLAAKNAVLLVDYIVIARRDHGLARREAILDACRKRARPIVMTSLAMGAGMLPLALGIGADPSFRAPMAIVVIGGLVSSTVLSLLVVPVVYSVIDDAGGWLARRPATDPV